MQTCEGKTNKQWHVLRRCLLYGVAEPRIGSCSKAGNATHEKDSGVICRLLPDRVSRWQTLCAVTPLVLHLTLESSVCGAVKLLLSPTAKKRFWY